MWRVEIEEKKLALRRAVLSRRNALTTQEFVFYSRVIQTRALQLPAYCASSSVALYSPTQNEVGTEEIFNTSLSAGRKIFYPRIGLQDIGEFVRVKSGTDLHTGRYGLSEPSGTELLTESDQQAFVVFVPGIAYDPAGNRLGRGKGWYDRILARLVGKVTLVGLAYDFQVVEAVPVEIFDRKVHYVVTETKLIDCAAAAMPLRQAAH